MYLRVFLVGEIDGKYWSVQSAAVGKLFDERFDGVLVETVSLVREAEHSIRRRTVEIVEEVRLTEVCLRNRQASDLQVEA